MDDAGRRPPRDEGAKGNAQRRTRPGHREVSLNGSRIIEERCPLDAACGSSKQRRLTGMRGCQARLTLGCNKIPREAPSPRGPGRITCGPALRLRTALLLFLTARLLLCNRRCTRPPCLPAAAVPVPLPVSMPKPKPMPVPVPSAKACGRAWCRKGEKPVPNAGASHASHASNSGSASASASVSASASANPIASLPPLLCLSVLARVGVCFDAFDLWLRLSNPSWHGLCWERKLQWPSIEKYWARERKG